MVMKKSTKNIKTNIRVVKKIKKVKKFSFDDGLLFLGAKIHS